MDTSVYTAMRKRDFVITVLASLMGALCGLLMFLVGSYFRLSKYPVRSTWQVEGWIPVASARDFPPKSSKTFSYGDIPGVILNHQGDLKAFSLKCSHFGCILKWVPARNLFVCPCHGGEFSFDGRAVGGPPEVPLNPFAVQIRKHKIFVKPNWIP